MVFNICMYLRKALSLSTQVTPEHLNSFSCHNVATPQFCVYIFAKIVAFDFFSAFIVLQHIQGFWFLLRALGIQMVKHAFQIHIPLD